MNPTHKQPNRRPPGRPPSRRRRAHQALPDQPPNRVHFKHDLVPQSPPQWINTPQALQTLLDHIRSIGRCTYDTEFIGEETYHTRLCLVQLATAERIAVIDALADLDLTGVWQLLADEQVLKVVHAGQQDLEPVVRLIGKTPRNIFDTQIAAGFAALHYPVSLARLAKSLLGVKPPKGLTFTQWDERPMSEAHVQYAADDVRFGLALHAVLNERLTELGHLDYALAATQDMCRPERFAFNPDAVYDRIRGAKGLEGRKRNVLRELVIWRDATARDVDMPPRTFCKDEVLMEIARRPPKTMEQLHDLRFVSRYHKRDHAEDIFTAIARGLERPPEKRSRKSGEPAPDDLFNIDKLWVAVQGYCYDRSVDPALVASRTQIARLYLSRNSKSGPNFDNLTTGWRNDFIGAWIKEQVNGA